MPRRPKRAASRSSPPSNHMGAACARTTGEIMEATIMGREALERLANVARKIDAHEAPDLYNELQTALQVADAALAIYQHGKTVAAVAPVAEAIPRQLVVEAIADLFTRMNKSYAAEPTRRITFMDIDAVYLHVKRMGIGGCLDGADEIIAAMPAGAPVATQPPAAVAAPDVCAEMRAMCSNCGGTGDVTRADGEWMGRCTCEYGTPVAAVANTALTNDNAIVPDWPFCNPACDYEDPYGGMHDGRGPGCACEDAKRSIARQRAALAAAGIGEA